MKSIRGSIIKKNNSGRIVFWLLIVTAMGLIANGGYIFAKAEFAQYLIATAWEKTLSEDKQVKPWPWADTWPVAKLQFGDNGSETSLYVLNGATGASLAFGPGHITDTAFPGESGSSIIAGHRDTHFKFLEDFFEGERIKVQSRSGKVTWYEVSSQFIADSRTQTLQTTQNANQLILVTCYPFNSVASGGTLRYVVTAKKIMGI